MRTRPDRGSEYPALDGDRTCDVVIVGGGFTGLSAAAHLAKAGADVVLIEAHRFGDGASGRNGGQLGTGQRAWAEEMEAEYGFSRAKALFDLAEEAKAHLLEFAAATRSRSTTCPAKCRWRTSGAMSTTTRRMPRSWRAASAIRTSPSWTPTETASGWARRDYFGGTRDTGTGHIHPLKLVIGTARVAAQAGAAAVRTDAVHRHHFRRRQGEGDDAEGHDHRRQMPDRASMPMAARSSR